jgi:hypothetical protein
MTKRHGLIGLKLAFTRINIMNGWIREKYARRAVSENQAEELTGGEKVQVHTCICIHILVAWSTFHQPHNNPGITIATIAYAVLRT